MEAPRVAVGLPAGFGQVRRQAAFLGERTAAALALAARGVLEIVGLRAERLPAWAHPARVPLKVGLPPDAVPQARPAFRAQPQELPGVWVLEPWELLGRLRPQVQVPRASRRQDERRVDQQEPPPDAGERLPLAQPQGLQELSRALLRRTALPAQGAPQVSLLQAGPLWA